MKSNTRSRRGCRKERGPDTLHRGFGCGWARGSTCLQGTAVCRSDVLQRTSILIFGPSGFQEQKRGFVAVVRVSGGWPRGKPRECSPLPGSLFLSEKFWLFLFYPPREALSGPRPTRKNRAAVGSQAYERQRRV